MQKESLWQEALICSDFRQPRTEGMQLFTSECDNFPNHMQVTLGVTAQCFTVDVADVIQHVIDRRERTQFWGCHSIVSKGHEKRKLVLTGWGCYRPWPLDIFLLCLGRELALWPWRVFLGLPLIKEPPESDLAICFSSSCRTWIVFTQLIACFF